MLKNYKLLLRYDGTKYHGWQRQPGLRTVQGELEGALSVITRQEAAVTGVSRTDAGVHAYEYVCNTQLDTEHDTAVLFRAVNGILDDDIRLIEISVCPDEFNARFDAAGKTYVYTIDNTPYGEPFLKGRAWRCKRGLDFEKMCRAAEQFTGTHDFSSFMSAGSETVDFTRTIYACRLSKSERIIEMEITGNGFLYNMVRIIAGTLVSVGLGRIAPEEISEIILKKDRRHPGITAPPQGLMLYKVYYSREDIHVC